MSEYSVQEERVNVITHAIGFALSCTAFIFLVLRATTLGGFTQVVSVGLFGFGLMVLYAASTLYHSSKHERKRKRLKIFDHAAIYVLIAGTYTPFTLITLSGKTGWLIFSISWSMAIAGIVLKLFFTGKYKALSTFMYVLMGWMIVFAINPLMNNLHITGLYWLVAGGVAYTIGAILYSFKQIKFNHAIFHIFVLIGSFCHFMAVYFYVL